MGRGACLAVSSRPLGQRQRRPDGRTLVRSGVSEVHEYCIVTNLECKAKELKTDSRHMMPPQVRVCNGLTHTKWTRPRWPVNSYISEVHADIVVN